MATIIVPAGPTGGATVSNVNLNDTLQLPVGTDLNSVPSFYEVDGTSTLQSLIIGYDIEVNVGFLNSGSLTGTGNITGPTDATGGNLPLLDNFGMLDINGTISTAFSNDGQTTVSAGQTLDLTGDLFSLGTITVNANGQLSLDDPSSAFISQIDVEGRLKSATKAATLQQTTNNGTIDITTGSLALTNSVTGTGSITVENGAKLDMSAASAVAGTVVLNAGSTLVVSQTTTFTGTLQIPTGAATIDLLNLVASSATVANGMLSIVTPSGTVSFAETGLTQGASYTLSSDTNGGTLIAVPSTATTTPTPTGTGTSPGQAATPVYRFFDTVYGTHLITQSPAEAQQILATRPDLTQETNNFGAVTSTHPSAEPVYRFFEQSNGTHFFTANTNEYLGLTTPGSPTYRSDLTYEPSSTIYEDATQQTGDVAVYRLFDATHGTQFLTGSQTEYAGLTTPGSPTYRSDLTSEGIAFYAPSGTFHT